jgi:hypothetical protein
LLARLHRRTACIAVVALLLTPVDIHVRMLLSGLTIHVLVLRDVTVK